MEFIVAPYEADAQMAYMAVNEDVHAVITEDSDLLAYGCPRVRLLHTDTTINVCMHVCSTQSASAPQVFFKLGKSGEGQEILTADLGGNRGISLLGFTPQMFLEAHGSFDD